MEQQATFLVRGQFGPFSVYLKVGAPRQQLQQPPVSSVVGEEKPSATEWGGSVLNPVLDIDHIDDTVTTEAHSVRSTAFPSLTNETQLRTNHISSKKN